MEWEEEALGGRSGRRADAHTRRFFPICSFPRGRSGCLGALHERGRGLYGRRSGTNAASMFAWSVEELIHDRKPQKSIWTGCARPAHSPYRTRGVSRAHPLRRPPPFLPGCRRAMGSPAAGDNDLPSLLRRSHLGTVYDHDIRFEHRNAEDVHKDALAAALIEHDRIREAALRAYELNELRLEQERLRLHALQEEERVRIETERAREECRLREIENKKKQIPVPAPRAKTPPPRAPSPPPARAAETAKPAAAAAASSSQPVSIAQYPPPQPPTTATKQAPLSNRFGPASINAARAPAQATVQPSAPNSLKPSQSASAPSYTLPHIERYAEIHQTLKKLRKMIVDEGKQNPAFKKKTGEMRRAIRVSMGQLTGEKGSNKQPVSQIHDKLHITKPNSICRWQKSLECSKSRSKFRAQAWIQACS